MLGDGPAVRPLSARPASVQCPQLSSQGASPDNRLRGWHMVRQARVRARASSSLGRQDGRPWSHVSPCLALLAVLDFLTSADGHGYTATRVLTVKAAQHKCLARAELRLIFGPAEADPVRATAVMRLLQQGGVPPLTHAEGGIAHACAFHWRFRR